MVRTRERKGEGGEGELRGKKGQVLRPHLLAGFLHHCQLKGRGSRGGWGKEEPGAAGRDRVRGCWRGPEGKGGDCEAAAACCLLFSELSPRRSAGPGGGADAQALRSSKRNEKL